FVVATTALFFFPDSCDPRDLHSFPTRRSSDLMWKSPTSASILRMSPKDHWSFRLFLNIPSDCAFPESSILARLAATVASQSTIRSEEHTSELQSRFDLVCRLLLEKKHETYKYI